MEKQLVYFYILNEINYVNIIRKERRKEVLEEKK